MLDAKTNIFNVGFIENVFLTVLNTDKELKAKIFTQKHVHINNESFQPAYLPDFFYYDVVSGIKIVIEVDEPYVLGTKQPIHCETMTDFVRDLYFCKRDCFVIRFSEKQVICQPLECVDFIKCLVNSFIEYLENNDIVEDCFEKDFESFLSFPEVTIEDTWDNATATTFAKENYRENYIEEYFKNSMFWQKFRGNI